MKTKIILSSLYVITALIAIKSERVTIPNIHLFFSYHLFWIISAIYAANLMGEELEKYLKRKFKNHCKHPKQHNHDNNF
ncbi:MAG: hypothetical protein LBH60_05435 [Prevotellaceae bacterium]|jgi:hypothetical protein|nr:hypothetical protein [Prevotellaceae bacterium]